MLYFDVASCGVWKKFRAKWNDENSIFINALVSSENLLIPISDIAPLLGYKDTDEVLRLVCASDVVPIAGILCINIFGIADAIRLSEASEPDKDMLKRLIRNRILPEVFHMGG